MRKEGLDTNAHRFCVQVVQKESIVSHHPKTRAPQKLCNSPLLPPKVKKMWFVTEHV